MGSPHPEKTAVCQVFRGEFRPLHLTNLGQKTVSVSGCSDWKKPRHSVSPGPPHRRPVTHFCDRCGSATVASHDTTRLLSHLWGLGVGTLGLCSGVALPLFRVGLEVT